MGALEEDEEFRTDYNWEEPVDEGKKKNYKGAHIFCNKCHSL